MIMDKTTFENNLPKLDSIYNIFKNGGTFDKNIENSLFSINQQNLVAFYVARRSMDHLFGHLPGENNFPQDALFNIYNATYHALDSDKKRNRQKHVFDRLNEQYLVYNACIDEITVKSYTNAGEAFASGRWPNRIANTKVREALPDKHTKDKGKEIVSGFVEQLSNTISNIAANSQAYSGSGIKGVKRSFSQTCAAVAANYFNNKANLAQSYEDEPESSQADDYITLELPGYQDLQKNSVSDGYYIKTQSTKSTIKEQDTECKSNPTLMKNGAIEGAIAGALTGARSLNPYTVIASSIFGASLGAANGARRDADQLNECKKRRKF